MPDAGLSLGSYQKFVTFEKKEVSEIFIGALVMGFIAGFARWGAGNQVDFLLGIRNTLLGVGISLFVLFIFAFATKTSAVKRGYDAKFKLSYPMVIASMVIVFVSYGSIWFFPIGGVMMDTNKKLRLGMFRYQFNLKEQSLVNFFGPFAVLLSVFFIKTLASLTNFAFIPENILLDLIRISVMFSLLIMLPIPGLNGLNIFFERPGKYFMYLGVIVGLSISLFAIDNIFLSLLIGFIFAGVFLFLGLKLMDALNAEKPKKK